MVIQLDAAPTRVQTGCTIVIVLLLIFYDLNRILQSSPWSLVVIQNASRAVSIIYSGCLVPKAFIAFCVPKLVFCRAAISYITSSIVA
jgi:hypothetical protein